MPFRNVLGHDAPKAFLARALEHGRVPPALLFAGPEGIGKKLLAFETARALVCVRARADCCGECTACDRASRGINPDVTVVEPATPTAIKIEQIRDLVREIGSRPFESAARAFVINDAHLMTEEASNALLKNLEEPPPTSRIFLVTASPQALLPTIRSRCQRLHAHALKLGVVAQFLRDRGVPPQEAHIRSALSGGSIGRALAFESETYLSLREDALALLETCERGGEIEELGIAQRFAESEDPSLGLAILRSLLRDLAALQAGAPVERIVNSDAGPRLQAFAGTRLAARALTIADVVERTRAALRGNANKLLATDAMLIAFRG